MLREGPMEWRTYREREDSEGSPQDDSGVRCGRVRVWSGTSHRPTADPRYRGFANAPDFAHLNEILTRCGIDPLSNRSMAESRPVRDLFPHVYDELSRVARWHLSRERVNHTLTTGALVHEAYLKLAEGGTVSWMDKAHFGAIASRAMRHILVDYARRRGAAKRGGNAHRVTLNDDVLLVADGADFLVSLDDALKALAEHDVRMSSVVEMRFFGGLRTDEIADALGVSASTIDREWRRAKAYLHRIMEDVQGGSG